MSRRFAMEVATLSVVMGFTVFAFAGDPASSATSAAVPQEQRPIAVGPKDMARLGTVDERFQSYNVEMIELTGGRYWKPYDAQSAATAQEQPEPSAGEDEDIGPSWSTDPRIFSYRQPTDLGNARLRMLAAALGPAYVRVSGICANATYFADSDSAPATPPKGFSCVLPRQRWKEMIDFARAVDGKIVTSFAVSTGVRDSKGVWTPGQARSLIEYTRSIGGEIAAVEFMNEPTASAVIKAPFYDAMAYGRDFKIFRNLIRQTDPNIKVMGPGTVGWRIPHFNPGNVPGVFASLDMLAAMKPAKVDVFSYHDYGAASLRCAEAGLPQTSAAEALSEAWLSSTDNTLALYRMVRDRFESDAPIWISESADAACGGNPWASTFLDTFRYLDQRGRLARQGVQVIMHNTLAASDYGLLDNTTFEPRPNYWAALLWHRLMDNRVLDAGVPSRGGLYLYAHCLKGTSGGVALLAINTNTEKAQTLALPVEAQRYTLASASGDLQSRSALLNGNVLQLGSGDELPALEGVGVEAGDVRLEPATITFLALPGAANQACR